MSQHDPIDLAQTYLFLKDGGEAPRVPVAGFWEDLMSGQPQTAAGKLVADGDGWLCSMYELVADTQSWEMHPAGDEVLFIVAGEIEVILDLPQGEQSIALKAGDSCLVPRGIWHRQVVRQPGRELALTYGKGSRHRPIAPA